MVDALSALHKYLTSPYSYYRATGLEGLAERAASYYAQGARFAKWRAVLQISECGGPTAVAVRENAWSLARYARAVQDAGRDNTKFKLITMN